MPTVLQALAEDLSPALCRTIAAAAPVHQIAAHFETTAAPQVPEDFDWQAADELRAAAQREVARGIMQQRQVKAERMSQYAAQMGLADLFQPRYLEEADFCLGQSGCRGDPSQRTTWQGLITQEIWHTAAE
ncbi:hypothetical protein WJX73_002225 [Symbiochloris irregularis]|uniref:Uncharacterized protein n=1 Tax=Symbiochloris irregularis TaxID=706552 RepID=A0AAW1P498_9CHLO